MLSIFYMARRPDEPEEPPKSCPYCGGQKFLGGACRNCGQPSVFLRAYLSLCGWLRRRARAVRSAYENPRGAWERFCKSVKELGPSLGRSLRDFWVFHRENLGEAYADLRLLMWRLRRVLERAYADPRGAWKRFCKSVKELWEYWLRGPRG